MQIARSLLLGALVYGATACASADLGPSTPNIPPLAFVRYINAMPDTLNTTVRWSDDIQFTPVTFVNTGFRAQAAGGWQGLRAGSRSLRVFPFLRVVSNFPVDGNTAILVDTTFNFEAGKYYTMVHTGFARTGSTPSQRLLIVEDPPAAQPATGTLVRVWNFDYSGSWDLYVGATTSFTADGTMGAAYTAGELGQLIGSGTPATVGTASAYVARTAATGAARAVIAGGLLSRHTRVSGPAGVAETADFEAAGGLNVAGSVITMFVFGPKTTGSPNSTGTTNTRPSVLFTVDRSPARVTAP